MEKLGSVRPDKQSFNLEWPHSHSLTLMHIHTQRNAVLYSRKKVGGPAKALHYKTYTMHVSFFLYYRTKQFLYM